MILLMKMSISKKPKCLSIFDSISERCFSILDSLLMNTIYTSKFCHDDVDLNMYLFFDHVMTEYNNDLENYFDSYTYREYYYDMDH